MRSTIYRTNAARARTTDKTPTLTDQAGAKDTDINIIVGRYGIGHSAPGTSKQPMFGDFSELPTDLRGMIEKARELDMLRDKLPPEYQHLSTQELLSTDPRKLLQITKDATTVKTRRDALPERFKRLSDQDILGLTDPEYQDMIKPVQPSTTPPKEPT